MSDLPRSRFSFTHQYLGGEIQFGAWGLLERGVSAINSLMVIASLTVYEYGVFQLLLSAYGFFVDLPSIGLAFADTDMPRFMGAGKHAKAKRIFFELHSVRLAASIALWALFFFGSELFVPKYGAEFVRVGKVLAFLFLADFATHLCQTVLKLRLRFGIVARRKIIQRLVQLVVLSFFFFTAQRVDIRGVLLSMVIGSFGASVVLAPAALRAYAPWRAVRAVPHALLFRTFHAYGKWALLRRMVSQVTEQTEPWLIKLFVNTEAVAIFTIAKSLVAAITNLMPTRTLGILLPMGIADRARATRIFIYGVKYHVALTTLAALGGFFLVPPVVRLLFPKYMTSLPYFSALLLIVPFGAFGAVPALFLRALQRQKFLFFSRSIKTAFLLPLMVVLLPLFGLWGLVFERWITLVVMVYLTYRYLLHSCPELSFRLRDLVHFSREDVVFLRGLADEVRRLLRQYRRTMGAMVGISVKEHHEHV